MPDTPRRPHPLLIVLGSMLGLMAVVWDALHVRRMLQVHLNDFGRFWYGARSWLEGGSLYEASVATPVDLGDGVLVDLWNLGSPTSHLLVLPLAGLSEVGAIAVWGALGVVALAWSARRTADELMIEPSAWHGAAAALAFACFAGTAAQLVTGQVAWLLLAPLTAAWIAARRGAWVRAAAILGVMTAFKPLFAVFLAWLVVRREGRAVVAWLVACALGVAVGAVVFGPDAYVEWAARLDQVSWSWLPMNGSLHGALTRLLVDNPVFAEAWVAPAAVTPLWLGLGGAVGVVTLVAAARADVDRGFALMLLCALLTSPLAWVYYHLLLVPPLVAVWRARPLGRGVAAGVAMAAVAPFAATWLVRDSPLLVATLGAPYLWATLALWAVLVHRSLSRAGGGSR